MPALQRSVSVRGAKFYRQGGKLMFVLHIDASTRVGPREALADDLDAHPEAFAVFEADDDGGALGPLVSFSEPAKAPFTASRSPSPRGGGSSVSAEPDLPPLGEVPAKRGKGAVAA